MFSALKVPSGQIRSALEWYDTVGKPLLGHQPLHVFFNFLNKILNILLEFKVPSFGRMACICTSLPSFRRTGLQKIRALYILCLEGGLKSS
jgi:hypothetical protein